jgi:hypothetical protein
MKKFILQKNYLKKYFSLINFDKILDKYKVIICIKMNKH